MVVLAWVFDATPNGVDVDVLFNAAMDASISRALTGEILRTPKGLTVTSRLTDQRHSVAGPAPYR